MLPILHLNGCEISNPTFVAGIAVGLALTQIAAAILRNQHGVLTVSSVLEGEFGLNGVSLGVPCILSRNGVERVLQVTLPPDEQGALVKSAIILRKAIQQLELAVASNTETERQ